jgi:internalin A
MRTGREYRIEESAEGRSLVVTGNWSSQAEKAVRRGEADVLVLNYALGFGEQSLDFLGEWDIRRLDVLDRSIGDLSPIQRLAGSLEELSVQAGPRAELDLGAFPRLRSIATTWDSIRGTLSRADRLESVIAVEFDEIDLHAFRDLFTLRRLTIKDAPLLESLSGIGDLGELAVLEIVLARRLRDIGELTLLSSTLVELGFDDCPSLDAIDEVETLVGLRRLGVSDCGRIASLAPVEALRQLELLYAWGSTRVEDNDLSPLTRLPRLHEIRMRDRREYRPRVAELVSALTT